MDALRRGQELLRIPTAEVPPLAWQYAHALRARYGACIELFLTAYTHYAQCVEGLPCDVPAYRATPMAWKFFEDAGVKIDPPKAKATPGVPTLAELRELARFDPMAECLFEQFDMGATSLRDMLLLAFRVMAEHRRELVDQLVKLSQLQPPAAIYMPEKCPACGHRF